MRQLKSKDKIKINGCDYTVTSIVLDTIFARRKSARQDESFDLDIKFEYIDEEKLTGKEKYEILDRLVKPEILLDMAKKNFQLSVLNKHIKKHPNLDFWRQFDPGFKTFNLLWYYGDGAQMLNFKYQEFTFDLDSKASKPDNKLSESKIGEDITVKQKPRNLVELFDRSKFEVSK